MRIALLHPSYWPEVRRGSERLVHDLATGLVERGHQVTLITSHPGRRSVAVEGGVRVVRNRRVLGGYLRRRHYEDHLTSAAAAAWSVLRGDYDVAHAFFSVDACAALWARDRGGPPVVFSINGIPVRRYLVARRHRLELMLRAISGADAATALSDAAADACERYLLRRPEVLPPGTFYSEFAVDAPSAERPTLICAASLNDRYKRAELLLGAFERLRERRPDARLWLAGRADPAQPDERLTLPAGAERIDGDRTGTLALAYSAAWASVLPARDEAFGLTLLESLAAGTPAVAARSGGCPDVITDEGLGRLFTPDDEDDLVRALDEALDLGRRPEVAEACRARARELDWPALMPRYERLYESVVERRARLSVRYSQRLT